MSQNTPEKDTSDLIVEKLQQYSSTTGYLRIFDDKGNEGRFVYLGLIRNGDEAFAAFRMANEGQEEKPDEMTVIIPRVRLNSDGEVDIIPVTNPKTRAALEEIVTNILRGQYKEEQAKKQQEQ
ncbi:MAG: hypothetical protein IIZ68_01105 [Clostridia bacterium]|nr:hypothetical protein [Clostridia bacterium]